MPEGELVLEVVRVRLADEQPISLERARFPADRFPGLLDRSLSGSLYELLESELRPEAGEAEERIEVVGATAAEARVLEVRRRRAAGLHRAHGLGAPTAARSSARTTSSAPTACASSVRVRTRDHASLGQRGRGRPLT